jgi:hypothetical protein
MRIKISKPTKKGFKNVQETRRRFDNLAESLGGHMDPEAGFPGEHVWMIPTDAGPLRAHIWKPHHRKVGKDTVLDYVHPDVDTGDITIFTRFEDPDRAASMGITSPNGKWNFHLGNVTPDQALEEFRRRITPIRQRQTRHTSTR